MKRSFIKEIQNFSFHNELFQEGDGVLIGISGGPDSVCLVRVFLELKEKYNLRLALLHVNYGLRGDDSEKDEKFVREFADENNLPLKVVKYQRKGKGTVSEELLRDFRYGEFENERKKSKFDLIAVGHTLDDQVETLLINMIRGSGLKGLSGISAKRDLIIRPLLAKEKSEIVAYLECIKQGYRTDQSNFELDFTRNKIRCEFIPFILKKFNANFKKSFFRLANNARRANEVVDEYVETTYNSIVGKGKDCLIVKTSEFEKLSEGLQSFLFRRIVGGLMGHLDELSEVHFFEFRKIIRSKKSKIQRYEFLSIVVERQGNELRFNFPKNKL